MGLNPAQKKKRISSVRLSSADTARVTSAYDRGKNIETANRKGTRYDEKLTVIVAEEFDRYMSPKAARAILAEYDVLITVLARMSPEAFGRMELVLGREGYRNAEFPLTLREQAQLAREDFEMNYGTIENGRPLRYSVLEAAGEYLQLWTQYGRGIELGAKKNQTSSDGNYRFNSMIRGLGEVLLKHDPGSFQPEKDKPSENRSPGENAGLAAWNAVEWLLKRWHYENGVQKKGGFSG